MVEAVLAPEAMCNCGHALSAHGGVDIVGFNVVRSDAHSGVCNVCSCPGFLQGIKRASEDVDGCCSRASSESSGAAAH